MKTKALSFEAHPMGDDKWKIATPFGHYTINQEKDTLGDPCYWLETPAGHHIETEVIESLDEAEQTVARHYHQHYIAGK